jgi:hypothetical protein
MPFTQVIINIMCPKHGRWHMMLPLFVPDPAADGPGAGANAGAPAVLVAPLPLLVMLMPIDWRHPFITCMTRNIFSVHSILRYNSVHVSVQLHYSSDVKKYSSDVLM